MPLLNVRLDPEDARKADELRAAGVKMSSVVREAIRREHARVVGRAGDGKKPSEIVREIIAVIPDDGAPRAREVDAGDRRAVAKHITSKLRARAK
jgi:hypothetical protein